jgi:RNase P subunit RPR2
MLCSECQRPLVIGAECPVCIRCRKKLALMVKANP